MEYWDTTMGPDERVRLRAGAVEAVRNGEKKLHVARRLGVTRQTLHSWVTRHQCGGTAALAAKPRGRVRRQVLEPWQEAHVAVAIMHLSPSTVSERYTRWTKKAIAGFVELRFGVRLSAWQVDSHLRRLGFGSHKAVRRAFLDNQARAGTPGWLPRATAEASLPL